MCHYITMVVGGVSEADLAGFMRTHGRQAKLVFNPSVQKILASDELHFLTTKGHCDCGTALDHSARDGLGAPELAVDKLKAKGWSEAKIERWRAAKEKAASKGPRVSQADSVGFWADLVRDLRDSLSPTSVGLLLHFYAGGIGTEKFAPRRAEVGWPHTIESALEALREDELTILPLAA